MATAKKKAPAKKAAKKAPAKKAAVKKAPAKKAAKKAPAKKVAVKKAAPKKKAAAKKSPAKKRTPNAAFMKPMTPSPALAAIIGDKALPRTEVTKKVWEYIKKHKLQNAENKRNIDADDKLKAIFGQVGVDAWMASLPETKQMAPLLKGLVASSGIEVSNPRVATPVGRNTRTLA